MGDTEVKALQGLTLSIHKGELEAIQSPSGSWKSTAVNMVGCLDVPSKGKIFLDGKNIASMSESELALLRGKKIGFIFQQFNLVNVLTAKENVELPMIFQDVDEDEREKRSEQLLRLVQLEERMDHRPKELSGGQQQRVAIARALSNDPEVVLADEPTGNLDSKTGEMVMGFLRDLHRKGKTIVMVTHDDHLAQFAQRIILLKDGKVIKEQKGKFFSRVK